MAYGKNKPSDLFLVSLYECCDYVVISSGYLCHYVASVNQA